MTGTIKVTDSAAGSFGALTGIVIPQLIQNVPQTDEGFFFFTHTATTSDIAIVFPSGVTNFGLCWFWNTDITNYVDIGPEVAGAIAPFVRLYPSAVGNQPADCIRTGVIPLVPGIAIRTQAHTGSVKVQIMLFNR